MRYSRFEALTIGVGGTAILATIALSLYPEPDVIELLAQVLLLGVLVAAVHWGRKGGAVAALGASVGYILLRTPFLMMGGFTPDILTLLIIRIATFGLVGIVGGEICGRIKYFFAGLEDSCSIDENTRVYNQRFIGQLLLGNVSSFRRYGAPFSICLVELSPALTAGLRPGKADCLVRAVADHIRNDVRLVDDVGRLDDGRFLLLLPHTPKDGAEIASARVRAGIRDVVGARDDSVSATVLSATEDLDAIQALLDMVAPAEVAVAPTPADGA